MTNRQIQPRPTREDMLAFVANGRPRPNAEWALCVLDRRDAPSQA